MKILFTQTFFASLNKFEFVFDSTNERKLLKIRSDFERPPRPQFWSNFNELWKRF